MARVTVEDCITVVPNRFKLVMVAAQRSRALSVGTELTVDRDNDKNPVVALREIAEETVSTPELEESLIRGLQKHVDVDEPVDEGEEMLAIEEALGDFAALGASAEEGEEGEESREGEDEDEEGGDAKPSEEEPDEDD